jgi:hypothetical protein
MQMNEGLHVPCHPYDNADPTDGHLLSLLVADVI